MKAWLSIGHTKGTSRRITVVPFRTLLPASGISLAAFTELVWLVSSTVGYVTLATSVIGGAAFIVVSGVLTRAIPPLWKVVTSRLGHVVPTRYVWPLAVLIVLTTGGANAFVKGTGQSVGNHTTMDLSVGTERLSSDEARIRPLVDGGFADASTCFFDEKGCVNPSVPAPSAPFAASFAQEHRDAFCVRHWAIERYWMQDGGWCELVVKPGTCDVVRREEGLALDKLDKRFNGVAVVAPQLDTPGFFDEAKIGAENWQVAKLTAVKLKSREGLTLRWAGDSAPLVRVEVPLSRDVVPVPLTTPLTLDLLDGLRLVGTTTSEILCQEILAFGAPEWLKALAVFDGYVWRAKPPTNVGLACRVKRTVLAGELETSDHGGVPALVLPVPMAPQTLKVRFPGGTPAQTLECPFPHANVVNVGGYAALPPTCTEPGIVSISGQAIDRSADSRRWYCWPDNYECTRQPQRPCCHPDDKDWQAKGCKWC